MLRFQQIHRNGGSKLLSKTIQHGGSIEPYIEGQSGAGIEPYIEGQSGNGIEPCIDSQDGGSKLPKTKRKPKKPLIKKPKVSKKVKYDLNNTGVINGKRYPISDIAELQSEILKIL